MKESSVKMACTHEVRCRWCGTTEKDLKPHQDLSKIQLGLQTCNLVQKSCTRKFFSFHIKKFLLVPAAVSNSPADLLNWYTCILKTFVKLRILHLRAGQIIRSSESKIIILKRKSGGMYYYLMKHGSTEGLGWLDLASLIESKRSSTYYPSINRENNASWYTMAKCFLYYSLFLLMLLLILRFS